MQTIVKFGLTKTSISSILHTFVSYGSRYLRGIRLFEPLVIQVAGQISFLVEKHWISTPYSSLLWDNLFSLQLEVGKGGCILENYYIETQQ